MTRKMEEKAGEDESVERLNHQHRIAIIVGLGSHANFPRSRDVTYCSYRTVPPSPAMARRVREALTV
jgi:hypothetical protein